MVCSWLKALQQAQAEAAEGMETGKQAHSSRKLPGLHYVQSSVKATSTSPPPVDCR